jgi:hypothetical protein
MVRGESRREGAIGPQFEIMINRNVSPDEQDSHSISEIGMCYFGGIISDEAPEQHKKIKTELQKQL